MLCHKLPCLCEENSFRLFFLERAIIEGGSGMLGAGGTHSRCGTWQCVGRGTTLRARRRTARRACGARSARSRCERWLATTRTCHWLAGTPTATTWPPAPTTALCASGTSATAAPSASSSATALPCAPAIEAVHVYLACIALTSQDSPFYSLWRSTLMSASRILKFLVLFSCFTTACKK